MAIHIRRFNCLRLWRIWNFFLILFLYTLLTYDSIGRYIAFKQSSMDMAFGSNYCPMIMNVSLMSIIAGLSLITMSLYCLFCSNGNYGDDGIRLGRDTDNLFLYEENEAIYNIDNVVKSKQKKGYLLRRFRRNFLPFSCLLHYLSALCFLMPMPFMEAHQIRQRVLTSNNLWHTDLDFLFDPDSWHRTFVPDGPVIHWLLRPQYFNLILSLVSISLRYAGVFWQCHKGFSFIFSLLMMLYSVHVLCDYSATSILVRLAYNPDFVATSLQITFLSTPSIMALSLIGSTVLLVSFWCVFEFGFQQFLETLANYRHMVAVQSETSHDGSNIIEMNCCRKKHLYLRGYLPHLSAICGVAVGVCLKIPLFCACINIVYKQTSDPLVLTNLLLGILFVCAWLITWFGFSLKPTWRFMLSNCSKAISDLSSTATTVLPQHRKQSADQVNQIYTCFHNLDNRLVMGDGTPQSRMRSRDYYGDETDLSNNVACTNYVYLQSVMNPAINPMLIPQQQALSESPLMTSFVEQADQRNAVSDSESSYDSATNIRNQLFATLDHQIGRSQSQTIRNYGPSHVLKYSGVGPRSHTPEYIPLQNEGTCLGPMKFELCSSPDTSTLHASESDTTLKSNHGTQQQMGLNSMALNRQNSNKKRTFGQRVTFKDDPSQDPVDCSPNNSEQSSNNTTSSDSGIDSNSKQHRHLHSLQTHQNFTDLNDSALNSIARATGSVTNSKCTPAMNSTKFTFDGLTSAHDMLNNRPQMGPTEELLTGGGPDDRSLSFISEDDQEPRLCSQV